MILNYFKALGFSLAYMIILSIATAILYYFSILNTGVNNVLVILIPIVSIFIGGYLVGKESNSKGYLEGLKFGLIFIFILLVISLIFYRKDLSIFTGISYLINILFSMLGSMVGINRKVKEK